MTERIYHGLEGVLAGESAICEVSHTTGGLSYRGYAIEDLALQASFEEVAFLLLTGALPSPSAIAEFKETLFQAPRIPEQSLNFLSAFPPSANRMDLLKVGIATLGIHDPDCQSNKHAANLRKATRLIAQIPALLEAIQFPKKAGMRLLSEPAVSHAERVLRQLTGKQPDPFSVKIMNISLILYAEHELNASTFSARVTASTLSDLHSAVTSAIGTLKGPLHGGANEAVMEMLIEIDQSGRVQKYVMERLKRKKRIMGFGHRVLRSGDPRSDIIKGYSQALGKKKGDERWFKMSVEIEHIMREEKGLYPNLDFYTASAYWLLGLPISLYTPLFVCSRIAGWAAHIIEQHDNNRLIRPRCKYTGSKTRVFVPLSERF